MLERTSEKLLAALASLEGLNVEPRTMLLDAKAQGLVLLKLINTVIDRPESEPVPSKEFMANIEETIGDYVRMVELLQEAGTPTR